MPLNDIQIRSFKPRNAAYKCFDGRGLYLEITAAGGKWWRLKYRFEKKEKRISLGTYPDVTLKEARTRRDDARRDLANGIDPSATRKALRMVRSTQLGNQFHIIAKEYLDTHGVRWSEAHSTRTSRLFERDILPWIGHLPISEIDAPSLLQVARRIKDRGALDSAHRCLQTCGQVFRYAIASGRAHEDPTRNLKGALPPKRGGHFAATTEPKRLGQILRAFDEYRATPVVRCALRLLPLLFVRPGELRRARWSDIDFEASEWRFTVSKTKNKHIVPLARQALEALHELKPLTGAGLFVFPSLRSANRPMSDNAVLMAMRSLGIPKEEMTGHGFRAVARTILDEVHGVRPDFIEHQLAHAVRDPNGRAYNRTAHLDSRRKMMQLWADYIDDLKHQVDEAAKSRSINSI